MASRNPNSKNQLLMKVLFGSKQAAVTPSQWTKWPEPQRSIYSRMLSNKLDIC